MRERAQKTAFVLLAFALLLVCVFAFLNRTDMHRAEANGAHGFHEIESYETFLAFGTIYHYGEIRHFEGSGVGLRMTCHTEGGDGVEDTFVIELHRMVFGLIDVQIGYAVVPRNGRVNIAWEDAGTGDFFLRFVKMPDAQVIVADDAIIYSY